MVDFGMSHTYKDLSSDRSCLCIMSTHVRSQTFREGGPNFVLREGDSKNLLREGEKLFHLGRG